MRVPRVVDGGSGRDPQHAGVDLRPVVWDATVVTPRDDRGVTIVLRARYLTLEELCADGASITRSIAGAAAVRHGRVEHDARADNAWTQAATA